MRRKKLFLWKSGLAALFCIILLSFTACEEQSNQSQNTSQSSSSPSSPADSTQETVKQRPPITVVDVPLNDPNGKPSTKTNYYFVFDGSGSMSEKCGTEEEIKAGTAKDKIDGAKEAFKRFLPQVPEDANLGLYVFDNNTDRDGDEVIPLGTKGKNGEKNRDAVINAIMAVDPSGGTPIGEAIDYATKQLVKQYKRQLGYGTYKIIVLTDGASNGNIYIKDAADGVDKYGFITIHTIGLCIGKNISYEEELEAKELISRSASYRSADNYAELEKALKEVVAESSAFEPMAFEQPKETTKAKEKR